MLSAGEAKLLSVGEAQLLTVGEAQLLTAGETQMLTAGEAKLLSAGEGVKEAFHRMLSPGSWHAGAIKIRLLPSVAVKAYVFYLNKNKS